jgi:hypothetical protein
LRDAARQELVRGPARAAALSRAAGLAALAAALVLPGCGGGDTADAGKSALTWEGTPVVRASSTGAHVLIGKVKNDSSAELRIRVPQVKVVDPRGRRIASTAVFSSTFVRSLYPHNGVARPNPDQYPEPEQERVGYLAVLGSGEDAPLTVSWRQRPKGRNAERIVLGSVSLPVPAAVSNVSAGGE